MLLSKLVGERIKETPSDVKIKSHALLLRAGFIKPVANGIFSLTMPGQLMVQNIEAIIRDEMNKIDGQEVKFPVVMPRELWESSGRYNTIGSEMARFKDRNGKDMLLGMTHEEAAVHLVKNTVSSYNQLPFMIYQIQTKFRDEPRCRGGLIRVREFTMKDAYSFHMTRECLEKYYDKCHTAYENIFRRIGLKRFISVKSDSGMMGGSIAHEFMLLSKAGEDTIAICEKCGYRANLEVATAVRPSVDFGAGVETAQEVFTGDAKEIAEVAEYLGVPAYRTIKAVVFAAKGEKGIILAFIRGDLEINEAKLRKASGKNIIPWDGGGEEGLFAGNIGPMGLSGNIEVYFDQSLRGAFNMVAGANRADYHIKGVKVGRDFAPKTFVEIAKVREGDFCPVCGAPLTLENGIEIGNIFQLGTKYTEAMDMTVLNEKGAAVHPIMGCYGIGVGRAVAAVAEESNDDFGMILPMTVAPFKVHITALRIDDAAVEKAAFALCENLKAAGVSVILDDRTNVSNGVKFADADLMGMPIRVVVSPRSVAAGEIEIVMRKNKNTTKCELNSAVSTIKTIISDEMQALS